MAPTLTELYEEVLFKQQTWRVLVAGQEVDAHRVQWRFRMGSVPTANIFVRTVPSFVRLFASVQIYVGWNGQHALVFSGTVESPSLNVDGVNIECAGMGRRLEVVYKRTIPVTFSGSAGTIVQNLLTSAGITSYAVNLPAWTLGTVVVQTIEFASYGEAINKVAEVDGSPWYEMPNGQIRVEVRDPIPGPTPFRIYFSNQLDGVDSDQPSQVTNVDAVPRLRSARDRKVPRDTRNSVTVLGAIVETTGPSGEINSDQVETSCDVASPFVPNPPGFQDMPFTNELIDTNAKAAQVCVRYVALENRLPTHVDAEVDGDVQLFLGATMQIEDPDYTGITGRWFLRGYDCEISRDDFVSRLDLIGGPFAGGTPQVDPFACFTWALSKIIQAVPNGTPGGPAGGGKAVLVTLDGRCSQDFDGTIASYAWTSDEGHSGTGPVVTFVADPAAYTSMQVTLTVTDDDGRTDVVTKTVIVAPTDDNPLGDDTLEGGGPLQIPTIYCAAGAHAQGSDDGAQTFNDLTKGAGGVSGDYISVSGRINFETLARTAVFGTTAGELMRTTDVCLTGSKVYTVPGAPRIEHVWCDVVTRDVWWATTSDGRIYRSGDDGVNWSLYHNFGDGFPVYRIATPLNDSLWAFGGDTSDPSTLVRMAPNKGFPTFVPIAIGGALLSAIVTAGGGFAVQEAASREYFDVAIIFNGGVSPVHWYTDDVFGDGSGWTPAVGLAVGTGEALAPGFLGPGDLLAVISSLTTYSAFDGINFAAGGNSPTQINHLLWEQGLDGVYIGAATGGIVKTVDHGDTWGYIRPLGALTWPGGDVGYMVSFEAGPLGGPGIVYIIVNDFADAIFQQLDDHETAWITMDGAAANSNDIERLRYFGGGLMFYGDNTNGGALYRSTDYGNSWAALAGVASHHPVDFDMAPDGRLWVIWDNDAASETSVYYSDDDGDNWTLSHTRTGLGVSKHRNIKCHPTNPDYIVCGFAHSFRGIHITLNRGASWSTKQNGGFATNDTFAIWGSGDRIVAGLQVPPVYVLYTSDDFGDSWTQRLNSGVVAAEHEMLKLGPAASSVVFSLNTAGTLHRSIDNGETWITMNIPAGSEFEALCHDVLTDALYALDNGGIQFRAWKLLAASVSDGGASAADWVQLPDPDDTVNSNAATVIYDLL